MLRCACLYIFQKRKEKTEKKEKRKPLKKAGVAWHARFLQ